ncbi:MAG: mechanosensitive ion channel [Helicobacteraceae bacterium]|nr:mechanosensitive ion channel [Helicobacteraceae bacterium]
MEQLKQVQSLTEAITSYVPEEVANILNFHIFANSLFMWIVALTLFIFLLSIRSLVVGIILKPLKIYVAKTTNMLDDKLVKVLEHTLKLVAVLMSYYFVAMLLSSNASFETFYTGILKTLITILIYWTIISVLNTYGEDLKTKAEKHRAGLGGAIAGLALKIVKTLIVIIALITIANDWGFDAMAIVASFGILGVGISLSSQDTIRHFWGSIVLFGDRPFVVGDWITVGSVDGTVEEIGIRSTKIRTFEKSIISVPNGTLANANILNWSVRPKRRIKMMLGVSYSTSGAQMKNILTDIRTYLKNNPKIHQEQILVYFSELADSSLNIMVYCFTKDPNWEPWLQAREEVYLELMSIVENNNSTIAFPSQSIYIENIEDVKNSPLAN